LADLAATQELGKRLASILRTGDVILLKGDLGVGKTALAREIVQAVMGPETEVPSPTFTLVQTYSGATLTITHADLYRIKAIQELAELGLDEALEGGALLVEWPERATELWPSTRLEIALSLVGTGQTRHARITGYGHWIERLVPLLEVKTCD
jgi:tRNA threonylcarbamoyladenosine biosynthesis protein TsaE